MKLVRIVVAILLGVGLLIIAFAYRNLNYDYGNDSWLDDQGEDLGFRELVYQTLDGNQIAYLEGPDGGPALLLIHGQMVSKEDYAKVLPALSEHFHIYAVDCYGHGQSSKNPAKYPALMQRDDLIEFVNTVIGETVVLSGHSSGALIASTIAAQAPNQVKALILEDGPFFATEPGRAEKTFSYQEFKNIHNFLNDDDKTNYTSYYLDHNYMQTFFQQDGKDHWEWLVRKPFSKRIEEESGQMPLVWYYPPELGLNALIYMTRNLQDGTGNYDLRFGEMFYDFTWFEGFDQAETLAQIQCPTLVLHVAPPEQTAPSYYDDQGILLAAMDEKDAERVHDLISNSQLKSGFESSHDIHADLPDNFVEVVVEFVRGVNL